jgi:hypothetical protein
MRIAPQTLYAALQRAQPTVNGYGDGAAALAALARVESDYDDSLVGDLDAGGSYGLWQVNKPSWPQLSYPPPPFPRQIDWLLSSPLLSHFNASGATNLPRWWRHGVAGHAPDALDVARETTFRIEYSKYTGTSPLDVLVTPPPPPLPGGGGDGGFFSATDRSSARRPTMTTPAVAPAASTLPDPSTLKAKLDAVRAAADKVRKAVDEVATVVASIPFIGAVIGGYVKMVKVVVDGLDDTIDALDNAL